MTARILPKAEWPKLAGTELGAAWPLFEEANTKVMVVEHEGAIVGCWAALRCWHLEGVWIHPTYRGRVSVPRRGLAFVAHVLRGLGVKKVWTHAFNDDVRKLIDTLGGQPVPGGAYIVPIGEP